MTTVSLKLNYFDFPGGRGEPARMALNLAGIAFEDRRIPLAEWPTVKAEFPYQQVPVMEVDGKVLNQSNAINRLVGKMADLYPQDNWQAAVCDDVMDTADDLMQLLVNTFFMPEEEKQRVRTELVAGPIPMFLAGLNATLLANGGEFFCDGRMTMADLKILMLTRSLSSGNLDYVPASIVAEHAADLLPHRERVEKLLA
jgi:glutathione S-transferase|tara:strand:+ start:760 stop:1356 length:597 start_codon:yes stop_codon:yes gene_type:complete